MVNGRAKGKLGEREVAKLHEAWWGTHEEGAQFKSTPQSGGFSTPEVRAHFKMAGDLMTTAKTFPFVVEVKRREAWDLRRVYALKPSPVWAWWRQACAAARVQGGVPILWIRKNRSTDWLVLVPVGAFHGKLPRLDRWITREDPAFGGVMPMLSTWDALRALAIPAIIKACRAYVLPPMVNPTSSPPTSRRPSNAPSVSSKLSQTEGYFKVIAEGRAAPSSRPLKELLLPAESSSSKAPSARTRRAAAAPASPSPTSDITSTSPVRSAARRAGPGVEPAARRSRTRS